MNTDEACAAVDEIATSEDTVDSIVEASLRDHTPLRRSFLQQAADDGGKGKRPGPLASFVSSRDRVGLVLYLLALTKASAPPYDTGLAAAVWARALDMELPESKTSTSKVSKLWKRIEDRQLIERTRDGRMARVHFLKEDGSGDAYAHPADDRNYFKLPAAFFTTGPHPDERWYLTLKLPDIAMLLIALSLGDDFTMPAEKVPDWYGISADTAQRGFKALEKHDLLTITSRRKKAPLTARGYTNENVYTLKAPFGPHGYKQESRSKDAGR